MTATYVLTHNAVRVTVTERDGVYDWAVFNGTKHVRSGVTSTVDLRALLLRIAHTVVMPSRLAQGRLRSIGTRTMARHQHVPARELRTGDLLYVGGTNYVLVASAEVDGDTVRILAHGGANPFTRAGGDLCNLSMRDASA